MPRGRPVDPETRQRIIDMCVAGDYGRNEIARQTGVAAAVVTGIAQEIGHVFDWSTTDLARAARAVEVGAMRTALAHAALLRAGEALEAMDAPTLAFHYQPKTKRDAGGWKEHTLPSPTISDQRNLATVFGILTQRAADLMRSTAGGGANADAASVLGGLGDALMIAAAALNNPHDDPTAEPAVTGRDQLIAELEAEVRDAEQGEDGVGG